MLHTYRVLGRPGAALLLFCTIALVSTPPAYGQRRSARAEPVAAFHMARDTTYWLEGAPFTVAVTLAPRAARKSVSGGELRPVDDSRHLFMAELKMPREGIMTVTASCTIGGYTAVDERYLVVEKPLLRTRKLDVSGKTIASGIDAWGAFSARVGEIYDPSAEFNNPHIPAAHYQTVVEFKGVVVFDKPGLTFRNVNTETQRQLTVTADMRPDDIVTKVYWRPGGTHDRTRWILLLCNQENMGAMFPLEKRRMRIDPAGERPAE